MVLAALLGCTQFSIFSEFIYVRLRLSLITELHNLMRLEMASVSNNYMLSRGFAANGRSVSNLSHAESRSRASS